MKSRHTIEPDQKQVPTTFPQLLNFIVPESGVKGRLDAWLAKQCPELSRASIQQLIKEGLVNTEGRSVKANSKPKPGDVYRVEIPPPAPVIPQPENIPLDVLYEDSDCIVINKTAGLVVHPAAGHPDGTLVNALLWHCKDFAGVGGVDRPGIVHRLDKDTSGVMVAVKNNVAMDGFIRLFQTGQIRKEYMALVHGTPEQKSGIVSSMIGRDPNNRKKMAVVKVNGKNALTHYRAERDLGEGLTLMHCVIETGRTHQIRVHMKSIGVPVIGDPLYGRSALDKKLSIRPRRQMLHAWRLTFTHPVKGKKLAVEAPLPDDFKAYLKLLLTGTELGSSD
ncbi:MAG: RluA family pseudouridine synthase [Kiritimatiellia bacterium]